MQYIIPAILALIVVIILWLIQKDKVALSYEITESDSFPVEKGSAKFFINKIMNTGNKSIQKIDFLIDYSQKVIETMTTNEDVTLSNTSNSKDQFKGEIDLFNPKEYLKVTITTGSKSDIPTPKVSAKAIGATAQKHQDKTEPLTRPNF